MKLMEQYRSQTEPDQPKPSIIQHLAWELITAFIPAILVALFINTFIAEAAEIKAGPSMQPNLYIGYRMMTEKVSYYFHAPQRGDIVIVEQPNGQTNLVKRVIGLPGETLESRDGHTYINGELLDEPWVTYFGGRYYPLIQIPEGYIFIIGDNRPNSHDSRAIGPVPIESVRGRVIFIYWPLEEFEVFP
jgi:signal peptidase I